MEVKFVAVLYNVVLLARADKVHSNVQLARVNVPQQRGRRHVRVLVDDQFLECGGPHLVLVVATPVLIYDVCVVLALAFVRFLKAIDVGAKLASLLEDSDEIRFFILVRRCVKSLSDFIDWDHGLCLPVVELAVEHRMSCVPFRIVRYLIQQQSGSICFIKVLYCFTRVLALFLFWHF